LTANPYRLPRSVVPNRYEIRLEPDLAAATFGGSESIRVDIVEPVTEIILNCHQLEIQ
jgi:puromycin-sensitive aminopeptidase